MSSKTTSLARTAGTVEEQLPGLVYALIAATISVAYRGRASIHSIHSCPPILPDPQMFHWSLEGRRAIYSSHQFR